MDEVLNHDIEHDNPKRQLLRLLRILTSFYSYRELERRLNIPENTLWKYYSLKVMPEKETAVKLLKKIEESGLLDSIIKDLARDKGYETILSGNIGIYELISYMISNTVRNMKIGKVFALPDNYSAIIASLIAMDNRLKLCLSDQNIVLIDSICHTVVVNNRPVSICYSKECLDKKHKSIVVGLMYSTSFVTEIYRFLSKYKQRVVGFYFMFGNGVKEPVIQGVEDVEKPFIKIFFNGSNI